MLASFGATVGRTRLMRLSGGAEVKLHVDQGYYWTERVRVHVPIVTQPTVRFECGDEAINMAAGECWIFDTWRLHRVLNADDRSRIHLVCDTVGGEAFWKLVDAGKAIGAGDESVGWQPRRMEFDDRAMPEMRFESHNVPRVMSPWELKRHLDFLLDETQPSPSLAMMRRQVEVLYRNWRALWANCADMPGTEPEYRRLFEDFLTKIKPLAASAVLRNDAPMLPALMIMVARTVAAEGPMTGKPGSGPVRQAPSMPTMAVAYPGSPR
ncbi:MAG TPA: aspartyl/asparaginyl beta-hydroxylase domain-containing protein [Pseudoxanthomonas sp.]